MKQRDLCGGCAGRMKEAYLLKQIGGGVDNKIICSHCGRRRYGKTYEIVRPLSALERKTE